TYEPAKIRDPRVLALAARVTHTVDPDSRYPDGFPGWVRVRLTDGRLLEARAPDGRGGALRPIEPEAIVAKFRANARRALPASGVEALEGAALGLDALPDVGSLMKLCRA
ncbi:MAG: MmgE/PrpD family protein, partial [Candidatus Rokubacteria bacterium]|nr:MmgE/PrpD family protein [Candidatus Rokubacteria bacterium]